MIFLLIDENEIERRIKCVCLLLAISTVKAPGKGLFLFWIRSGRLIHTFFGMLSLPGKKTPKALASIEISQEFFS